MNKSEADISLPGEELVKQGLADLAQGRVTDFSWLVLIAAPRLRGLGIQVPEQTSPRSPEVELYSRLEQRLGAGAHSYYNGLLRRIVSYARALDQEQQHR